MALLDGTNAPAIKVYLDAGNRTSGKFIFSYSLLGGTDTLGANAYTPFATLTQLPSDDVRSISIRRGRTREDQNFQAGQLTFVMDNLSGNYDPQKNVATYQGSDGKSILCGNTGVRVTATYGGTEYVIYSGYIEQIILNDDIAPTVEFICVDAITQLGKKTIRYIPSATDLLDTDVVNSVLDAVGWPSSFRDTTSYDQAISPKMDVTDSALTICTNVAAMQLGKFFIDRLGQPKFLAILDSSNPTYKMRLTDQRPPAASTHIEYDFIDIAGGEKYVVNVITMQNTTGDYTVTNGASVSRYGGIEKTVTGYFLNGADARSTAQTMVDYWGTPQYRVESIEFDGYGLTDWANILTSDIGDGAVVYRQSTYNSSPTTYYSAIEALNHDITANSWRVSLNLSPIITVTP